MNFRVQQTSLHPDKLRTEVTDPAAGGFCAFEGWVRNHNQSRTVKSLEYQAYDIVAIKQGHTILTEAHEKYNLIKSIAVHRLGHLQIEDIAVYVAVSAKHRDAAFEACRYIIDNLKYRVAIWKKEHYTDGSTEWIDPTQCHCADPKNICEVHK